MGIKRLIKHVAIPGSGAVDMVKNMIDEGSVMEGIKKSVKQNYTEDNPFTKMIYEQGKLDGKVKGYIEASDEYEIKFLEQADMFIQQKVIYENERDEYEKLLDAYEAEIEFLANKAERTPEENAYLQQLLLTNLELRKLSNNENKNGRFGSYEYNGFTYGIEPDQDLEDYYIEDKLVIEEDEVYSVNNKKIHIKDVVECYGTLNIENCEIVFYGKKNVFLSESAEISCQRCFFRRMTAGKSSLGIKGCGTARIENSYFFNLSKFMRLDNITVIHSFIKDCYSGFIDAESMKMDSCSHVNECVPKELQQSFRNPQTGKTVRKSDPPFYMISDKLEVNNSVFMNMLEDEIPGVFLCEDMVSPVFRGVKIAGMQDIQCYRYGDLKKKRKKNEVSSITMEMMKTISESNVDEKEDERGIKTEVVYQFHDVEYAEEGLIQNVYKIWENEFKKDVEELKSIRIYLKPDEDKCYFVLNDDISGTFDLK